MKKCKTILRMIDELECELYQRFSAKEIKETVEKEEKNKKYYGGSCGLVYVIYTGACDNIMAEEIAEEDRLKEMIESDKD